MPRHRGVDPLELYAALMSEAKARLSAIGAAVEGRTGLVDQLVREFCFLQLRLVCELIALACLTAHGSTSKKLDKQWHAGIIIRTLSDLHPRFYPRPMVPRPSEEPARYHFADITSDFLSKDDLIKLYESSADALHRGSIKKLLSARAPRSNHFHDISQWLSKTYTLLAVHVIDLARGSENRFLICELDADPEGSVQVSFANVGS